MCNLNYGNTITIITFMMTNILLPLIFVYLIWLIIKPEKSILKTPLFGYSLNYYIFKETKPDENFRFKANKYEK